MLNIVDSKRGSQKQNFLQNYVFNENDFLARGKTTLTYELVWKCENVKMTISESGEKGISDISANAKSFVPEEALQTLQKRLSWNGEMCHWSQKIHILRQTLQSISPCHYFEKLPFSY